MTTLYRSSHYLLMLVCLILGACTPSDGPKQAPAAATPSTANEWLQMATGAPTVEQASQYRLNAARLLYDQGDYRGTEQALGEIKPGALTGPDAADYLSLRANIIAHQHGPASAAKWLAAERPQALLAKQAPADRVSAYATLAELYAAAGHPYKAIDTRLAISPWLTEETQRAKNQDRIWSYLLELTPEQLRNERATASNPELQGWLELALVAVDNRGDLEQQRDRLTRWQQTWPSHPAAQRLPGEMELLQYLSEHPATRIAALLPLQGRLKNAGNAIRDGIIAAYLDGQSRSDNKIALAFYDTETKADIQQLYQQAVAEGAELVIGPLAKPKVNRLSQLESLPIPVLALNYLDAQPNGPAQTQSESRRFFQFGLSSADDARAAADFAWNKNYRRALVVQTYDSQSKRTAAAFLQAWDDRGGDMTATLKFDNEHDASNAIRDGLHIPLSQQRADKLQAVSGQPLEFTPRRRQDIDFAYLPLNAQQARSIKPLLAFHFAHDLPVIASSRVFTGKEDARIDSDLNGIYFSETPWTLGASPALSSQINRHIEAGAPNSKNLYALGMDAYQLAPRMTLMAYSPAARYSGLTGTLLVSKQGTIIRVPSWAVFRKGIATPLSGT